MSSPGAQAGPLDRPRPARCDGRLVGRRGSGRSRPRRRRRWTGRGSCRMRLEVVVGLGAPAQALGERRRADRQDHELLEVDVVVGVGAAVEDVHHRHRQHVGVGAADVAVQRQLELVGGGLGHGEGHAEDGVGAEAALVVGAVGVEQGGVDAALVERLEADDGVAERAVDVGRPRWRRPCRRSGRRRRAARPPRTRRSTRPTAPRPGPRAPDARKTSTSTVGLPRESRISRPTMCSMSVMERQPCRAEHVRRL